jgi:hypothetical protein
MDNEQGKNLERVADKIGGSIIEFMRMIIARGPATAGEHRVLFSMEGLHAWVTDSIRNVAPDSPSRILRMLRQQGKLDYVVVSRSDSVYEIKSVAP